MTDVKSEPQEPSATPSTLERKLKWVRSFCEYARYVLEPGTAKVGSQFPHQADADRAMKELDEVLAALRPSEGPETGRPLQTEVDFLKSLAMGLHAVSEFISGHSWKCNGGEDGPCDCGYVDPKGTAEALQTLIDERLAALPAGPETP